MKRILFISPWSDDWDIKEIKRSPENAYFLESLLKEFKVYHVFLKGERVCTPLSPSHHLFPVKRFRFKEPLFFFLNYFLNNLNLYLKAKEIIERYKVNLVLCSSSKTILAGYLIKVFLRKKVILKLYGIYTYFTSGFFQKILLLPERISFYLPFDFIFCVDDGSGGERLRKLTGFARERFKVLKNAYPSEWKDINAGEISLKERIVLGVSALEKCKGFEYFVKCAKEVLRKEDALFILCGEGPERKRLERLVKSVGIEERFKFAGGVPHPKMPEYYLKSWVFVSTNLYGNKTIPVIEAMFFGLPVITFEIGEERELIREGKNGFLVPPGDYISLAERLKLLLSSQELREKMGKFARKWVLKNYPSWKERIKEEIKIINKFL